jgi:hypothetical protein
MWRDWLVTRDRVTPDALVRLSLPRQLHIAVNFFQCHCLIALMAAIYRHSLNEGVVLEVL